MARPLRIEYDGAVYHITSRGNQKKLIYKDDQDRQSFLDILQQVNFRYNWICHAYCLMNNHYHLVIETPDGNLSKGMRQLNGVYTQAFNRRHKRVGHIFQGRYKAILIQKESHLLEVCRYVALNPVRARTSEKPEQWKWSSYRGTVGKEKAHLCLMTDWVLSQFGKRRKQAQRNYRGFVNAGIGGKDLWNEVRGQSLLGEDDFVESLIGYIKGYEEVEEIPREQRFLSRPKLQEVFNDKRMSDKKKRSSSIHSAHVEYGYTLKEIAAHLGVHYTTV
ncbi:MAG TPA: addiction module toxin RelE, partial [Nitrospirae bacterium]|nr:addiction module toxin RelE [Nitrospirota bacterium]